MEQGAQEHQYTPEQEQALQRLCEAFDITYSKEFTVSLVVHEGTWQEAEVNPNRRIIRKSHTRRRI